MISIIIPAYNLLELTKKLVYSIHKYTKDIDYELICIDDSSNDGTYDYFKTVTDKAIRLDIRQGFSYICNKGLGYASKDCEFVTIMNNDMFVGPGWLSDLVKTYNILVEKKINVWCVSSKLVYGNFSEEAFIQECGKYINEQPYLINNVTVGSEIFPSIIPTKLIIKNGLFHPDFHKGMYYEDVDMYHRYKSRGYIAYRSPNSRVFHFGPNSTAPMIKNIKELTLRNKTIFQKKWGRRR